MTTATTATRVAPWEVRDRGELDIKILEMGGAPEHGASTDEISRLGRPRGSNRGHSTRKDVYLARFCDDADDAWSAPDAAIYRGGWRARPGSALAALAGAFARGVAGGLGGALLLAGPVAAHGVAPAEAPTAASILLGWTFAPLPTLPIVIALGWWLWAVRRVDRAHPGNPVPRRRTVAFLLGMLAIAFALMSGIERYDTTLFSVHMVQHILLTLIAAPLIAMAAPITLVLRLSSAGTRRRWVLPVLHSRLVRVVGHPVVAWIVFAAVMWGTHFSPLFDASLEDPIVHDLEHGLFLGAALLFWWPAVGLDPSPWRLRHPARIGYLFTQMTQNTFLAVAILNASDVLYRHYASLQLAWGTGALEDQRLAAGLMWIAGDAVFLTAIMALIVGWMRVEKRAEAREDVRADAELAEIRIRERRLADRIADERSKLGG